MCIGDPWIARLYKCTNTCSIYLKCNCWKDRKTSEYHHFLEFLMFWRSGLMVCSDGVQMVFWWCVLMACSDGVLMVCSDSVLIVCSDGVLMECSGGVFWWCSDGVLMVCSDGVLMLFWWCVLMAFWWCVLMVFLVVFLMVFWGCVMMVFWWCVLMVFWYSVLMMFWWCSDGVFWWCSDGVFWWCSDGVLLARWIFSHFQLMYFIPPKYNYSTYVNLLYSNISIVFDFLICVSTRFLYSFKTLLNTPITFIYLMRVMSKSVFWQRIFVLSCTPLVCGRSCKKVCSRLALPVRLTRVWECAIFSQWPFQSYLGINHY